MAAQARSKAKAPAKAPATRTPEADQAAETFEATCPTCGMTADVPGDLDQVRCRRCGTAIRLVDHEVPPAQPVLRPLPQPEPLTSAVRQPALALVVGLLAPVLVGFAFGVAHTALDRPEPDTGTAGLWFMACLVLAAAAVYSQWPLLGPPVGTRAPWGILIGIPAFILILMAGQSYDDDGMAWVILGLPVLLVYVVALGITAAVMANRRDGAGAAAVLVTGVGVCMAFGVAAAYMLMTLDQQAAEAREAHEAPAWGLVLAIGVLLGMAAHRRRTA